MAGVVCGICGRKLGLGVEKYKCINGYVCRVCFNIARKAPSISGTGANYLTLSKIEEAYHQMLEDISSGKYGKNGISIEFDKVGLLGNKWAVHSDALTIEWTEVPYDRICNVRHDESSQTITLQTIVPKYREYALDSLSWGSSNLSSQFATTFNLRYSPLQAKDASIAYEYIKEHSLDGTVSRMPKAGKDGVFRLKCNSCGKTFSFTTGDLQQNAKVAQRNKTAALGQLAAVASGNQGAAIALKQFEGEVKSYNRCPYCNSRDVEGISAKEMSGTVSNPVNTLPTSAADEILKLKELLDAGILTQEEFDAAKRKALGI